MTQEQIALAQQLRALHLPEPVGYWPPAPGWWLLAIVLLLGGALALFAWVRRRQQHSLPGRCRRLLVQAYARWQRSGATDTYLHELAAVLRRVALQTDERTRVAGLSEADWMGWLAQASAHPLDEANCRVVASDLYRRATPDLDVPGLHRDLLRWAQGLHA